MNPYTAIFWKPAEEFDLDLAIICVILKSKHFFVNIQRGENTGGFFFCKKLKIGYIILQNPFLPLVKHSKLNLRDSIFFRNFKDSIFFLRYFKDLIFSQIFALKKKVVPGITFKNHVIRKSIYNYIYVHCHLCALSVCTHGAGCFSCGSCCCGAEIRRPS